MSKKKPTNNEDSLEQVMPEFEDTDLPSQEEFAQKSGDVTDGSDDVQTAADSDVHADCQDQLAQMEKQYFRAMADYNNLERRVQEERRSLKDTLLLSLLKDFLPVVDNLDRALSYTNDPGIKMIKDQLMTTLKRYGVEELNLLNTEYDPHFAEAIESVEGEEDNIIVKVHQPAYIVGKIVIQPARVSVSQKAIKNL